MSCRAQSLGQQCQCKLHFGELDVVFSKWYLVAGVDEKIIMYEPKSSLVDRQFLFNHLLKYDTSLVEVLFSPKLYSCNEPCVCLLKNNSTFMD